jgi:ribulose kinase
LGDAILAGVAAGCFRTIEMGCENMVVIKEKITPDFQAEDYVVPYQRYRDLDQTLSDYFSRQYE